MFNLTSNMFDEKMAHKAVQTALTAPADRRVGSVLVKGKRIVAASTNLPAKSHPMQARYAQKSGHPRRIYLHAEMRCLLRATKSADTIYVARVSKYGDLRMAKPCATCSLALEQESSVRHVWYSVTGGWEYMEVGNG